MFVRRLGQRDQVGDNLENTEIHLCGEREDDPDSDLEDAILDNKTEKL